MIKRDITETIYEYDDEGKLLKKTVTETHEEETDTVTVSTYRATPSNQLGDLTEIPCKEMLDRNDSIRGINDVISCLAKSES